MKFGTVKILTDVKYCLQVSIGKYDDCEDF